MTRCTRRSSFLLLSSEMTWCWPRLQTLRWPHKKCCFPPQAHAKHMHHTLQPAARAYPPPTRMTISHGISLWKSFQVIMGANGSSSEGWKTTQKGTYSADWENDGVSIVVEYHVIFAIHFGTAVWNLPYSLNHSLLLEWNNTFGHY